MNGTPLWETIFEVGAEGGSIKLLGNRQGNGKWIFRKNVVEMSFQDFGDEPVRKEARSIDILSFKSNRQRKAHEANTWEEAMQLLEAYPWKQLNPRKIHPEFNELILKELLSKEPASNKRYKWLKVLYPEISSLIRLLKSSSYTVLLTGAGMSVESGIPDFRSSSGWWKNIDPRTVATVDALEENYSLFQEFYNKRIIGLKDCEPHEGHYILADWEKRGLLHSVATQNVDGFHSKAGTEKVSELHGSIRTFRCHSCSAPASEKSFLNKEHCTECGGNIRPNVVLFGEMLPEGAWGETLENIQKAKLVIVIGTSLEVYPVNELPSMTNGKTVFINSDDVDGKHQFDLIIKGKAKEILMKADELMELGF